MAMCRTDGLRLPASGHITPFTARSLLLPIWCKCGNIVTYSNEERCEDCFVNDTIRYHGRSKHIDVPFLSAREDLQSEHRGHEIRRIFERASHERATIVEAA